MARRRCCTIGSRKRRGAKKSCRYGVNKRTKRCLKSPRKRK